MAIPRCLRFPAFLPPANARPALHGANRLGGNSLSDLLVFGKRAGEHAAKYREGQQRAAKSTQIEVDRTATEALRALRARPAAVRPVPGAARSAGNDAGSGRDRAARRRNGNRRMEGLATAARQRAAKVGVAGQSRIQPRLAHRLDLRSSNGIRSDHPIRDRSEGKPRRTFPRRLSREGSGPGQIQRGDVAQDPTGRCNCGTSRSSRCRPS